MTSPRLDHLADMQKERWNKRWGSSVRTSQSLLRCTSIRYLCKHSTRRSEHLNWLFNVLKLCTLWRTSSGKHVICKSVGKGVILVFKVVMEAYVSIEFSIVSLFEWVNENLLKPRISPSFGGVKSRQRGACQTLKEKSLIHYFNSWSTLLLIPTFASTENILRCL